MIMIGYVIRAPNY